MKKRAFPILIREQSVTVKVYRLKAKTTKDGFSYCVTWVGPDGRAKKSFAALTLAKEFAELKAAQLAAGLAQADQMSRSDVMELTEARRLAGTVPLLHAIAEWQKAREFAGPAVLEACEAWSARRAPELSRIKFSGPAQGRPHRRNEHTVESKTPADLTVTAGERPSVVMPDIDRVQLRQLP